MKNSPVKLNRMENVVNIDVALSFYGPSASKNICENKKATYAEVALEGIKSVWNSHRVKPDEFNFFGDYNKLYVNFNFILLPLNSRLPHLKVFIRHEGQPICFYNVFWNISGFRKPYLDDITLQTYFKRKLSEREFMLQAAHEIGHIFGLGDAYEGALNFPLLGSFPQQQAPITYPAIKEVPLDEVMRSNWTTAKVYPNTIEMILEAFKTNKLQKYDPRQHSKVIRSY